MCAQSRIKNQNAAVDFLEKSQTNLKGYRVKQRFLLSF